MGVAAVGALHAVLLLLFPPGALFNAPLVVPLALLLDPGCSVFWLAACRGCVLAGTSSRKRAGRGDRWGAVPVYVNSPVIGSTPFVRRQ